MHYDEEERIKIEFEQRLNDGRQGLYSWWRPEVLHGTYRLSSIVVANLAREGWLDLRSHQVLDIGTGSGRWLRQLLEWGASPENLHGLDLVESRVELARRLSPHIDFRVGNAWALPFDDASMDFVSTLVVLSSITDPDARLAVASEMRRVVKPGGRVMVYDFWISDPRNPHTVGIGQAEVHRLFPGYSCHTTRFNLAPPIARRLGPLHPGLIGLCEYLFPFLRTHAVYWLRNIRNVYN